MVFHVLSMFCLVFALAHQPNAVGFRAEPDGRGTISMTWQCLSTIFLCTFTVLHFDIPRDPPRFWSTVKYSCFWVVLGLFAPESICFKSYRELVTARQFAKSWNRITKDSTEPISTKQAFYLIAGGIDVDCFYRPLKHTDGTNASMTMDMLCYDLINHEQINIDGKKPLLESIRKDIPKNEELDALSRADVITKIITLTQAVYFLVQVVARLVWKLDVSPLEVFTVGFVGITLMTYCFWFRKPYHIGLATPHSAPQEVADKFRTHAYHVLGQQHKIKVYFEGPYLYDKMPLTRYVGLKCSLDPQLDMLRLISDDRPSLHMQMAPVILFGLILAGIHLAAWSYPFPTRVETWLWRAAALSIAMGPLGYYLWRTSFNYWIGQGLFASEYAKISRDRNRRVMLNKSFRSIASVGVLLYSLMRLYMIVEVFFCLRSAPASIYDTPSWSQYWPHIG